MHHIRFEVTSAPFALSFRLAWSERCFRRSPSVFCVFSSDMFKAEPRCASPDSHLVVCASNMCSERLRRSLVSGYN